MLTYLPSTDAMEVLPRRTSGPPSMHDRTMNTLGLDKAEYPILNSRGGTRQPCQYETENQTAEYGQ